MTTLIGVLLDVSASMKENAAREIAIEDTEWASSLFEVIDNFIKYDVLLNNHIFAIGVGGRYGKTIFDVFKTMENLVNRKNITLPSTYEDIVEKILKLVEENGAQNIRKWAPLTVIKESLSPENAVFFLRSLETYEEGLEEFVKVCFPDVCKDVQGNNILASVKQKCSNLCTTALTQVVTAKKENILAVVEQANSLLLRDIVSVLSFQKASTILNGCNHKENLSTRITELMKSVEPFIYGETQLHKALHEAKQIFSKDKYRKHKKLFFVLSAGEPTDDDYTPSIVKALKDMDVIVVSCLVTSKNIKPQKLFSVENKEWNKGAHFLFQLSSTLASQLLPRTIFINQGWDIEIVNNETKLFLQVNHPDNIKSVFDLARDVVCCQDTLSDLMSSVSLDIYINQTTSRFPAPLQEDETCYANASAVVLHLAMMRIIGRENGYPKFEDLRKEIIAEYGIKGSNTKRVLEEMTKRYKLQYDIVTVEGAMEAIVSKRPVVATFRLTDAEWDQFENHFDPKNKIVSKHENGTAHNNDSENENASDHENDYNILTKAVIDISKRDMQAKTEGHAVVLTSFNSKCFRFMNSWGETWGEKGFFRVENAEVLDFKFIDVYWTLKDLSDNETANYKKEGPKVAEKLIQQLTCLKTEEYTCPSCSKSSLVSLYTGSLSKAVCPKCSESFDCNEAGNILALNMYLTSLAK